MALTGKGRLYQQKSKTFAYFPKEVSSDSQFPLEAGNIIIEINGETVILKNMQAKNPEKKELK